MLNTIMASFLTSTNSCGICCEDFNKSTRAKVDCPRCEYPVCRTCTRIYLVGTTDLAHCLNCKKQMGTGYFSRCYSKVFCKW